MNEVRQLLMPKIGLTMTEGSVSEWPIAEGGCFERGAIYAIVETDKVTNELEAPEAGKLTRILVPAGETVDVGTVLAEWESEGSAEKKSESGTAKPSAKAPDLTQAADSSGTKSRKASSVEMTIAKRLTEAKQTIPHFYLSTEIEVSRLQDMRAGWNNAGNEAEARTKASLTHVLAAAVARAIAKHRDLNRVWNGEGFSELGDIDVGVAIDTDEGLVAPVIRRADQLDLRRLSQQFEALIHRARTGALTHDDVGGGLITISNAGMHDVTWMASIINPGQAAILGVGSERSLFRPDASGAPKLVRELSVVLSCDHRVLSGVQGLRLLNEIRSILETPDSLFV